MNIQTYMPVNRAPPPEQKPKQINKKQVCRSAREWASNLARNRARSRRRIPGAQVKQENIEINIAVNRTCFRLDLRYPWLTRGSLAACSFYLFFCFAPWLFVLVCFFPRFFRFWLFVMVRRPRERGDRGGAPQRRRLFPDDSSGSPVRGRGQVAAQVGRTKKGGRATPIPTAACA